MSSIEQQIIDAIEKIRPFINRDGGDIVFDSFENGIAYVRLLGACEGCAMINETIESGVAIIIKEEVPGVIDVRLASDKINPNDLGDFRLD